VDAGLLWLWSHGEEPLLREEMGVEPELVALERETRDYVIEGADAEAAGRRFGQFPPRYLYDRGEELRQRFRAFAASEGLDATVVPLAAKVPHRRRVDHALEAGGGAGPVLFHGAEAVAIGGVPTTVPLPVVGERMDEGEFAELWRWVVVHVRDGVVARSEEVAAVTVDEARLILADADALGAWRHDEPLDGRADIAFWGRDAEALAVRFPAPELEDGVFGWKDLDVAEAASRVDALETERERAGLVLALDFRPHSHHHGVLEQMRASATESGAIAVGGATMCAFFTGWGDGLFPVSRDLDADGRVLQIRVHLGHDAAVDALRRLQESGR
jgi:hypothetical protein